MEEVEVGIRELRNDTRRVIDLVHAGRRVILTSHGARVAEIRSINPNPRTQHILDAIDALPPVDPGFREVIEEQRRADRSIERDWR